MQVDEICESKNSFKMLTVYRRRKTSIVRCFAMSLESHELNCCSRKCNAKLDQGSLEIFQLNLAELTFSAKSALVCGAMIACKSEINGDITESSTVNVVRSRSSIVYSFRGERVCRLFWMNVYDFSNNQLRRIYQLHEAIFSDSFEGFEDRRGEGFIFSKHAAGIISG